MIQDTEYEKKLPHFGPISPLSDDERNTITGVHNAVIKLNKACVDPLLTQVPTCFKAVDPFSSRDYVPNSAIESSPVIPEDGIKELANSFYNHPAIGLALKTKGQGLNPDNYDRLVREFVKTISSLKGDVPSREFYGDLKGYPGKALSPERMLSLHLLALFCIRASLDVLNQLVYQALVSNKLLALTRENVIEIGEGSIDMFGENIDASYLVDKHADTIYPFELILLKYKRLKYLNTEIFRVMSLSHSLGEGVVDVQLRPIDDNMNPHGRLLKRIG